MNLKQSQSVVKKSFESNEVDVPISKLYTNKEMLKYMLNKLNMSVREIAISFNTSMGAIYRYVRIYKLHIKNHGLQKGRKAS